MIFGRASKFPKFLLFLYNKGVKSVDLMKLSIVVQLLSSSFSSIGKKYTTTVLLKLSSSIVIVPYIPYKPLLSYFSPQYNPLVVLIQLKGINRAVENQQASSISAVSKDIPSNFTFVIISTLNIWPPLSGVIKNFCMELASPLRSITKTFDAQVRIRIPQHYTGYRAIHGVQASK